MKRLWRRFRCHLVDEIAGMFTLHVMLRNLRQPPLVGRNLCDVSGLFSGDLHQFYKLRPVPVILHPVNVQRTFPGGGTVQDFAFPSLITSGFSRNDRVLVRRWQRPESNSDVTILGADGIVQLGSGWFHRLASRVLSSGVEVAMMDTPFNFRRTPTGYRPGQLIVSGDLHHQLSVSRQAVLDFWTVLENLKAEGRRVGLVGVSFGGWLSLMTSVLASRVDFVIAVVPPVDMSRILREGGTIVRAARRGLGRVVFDETELNRISRVVSPLAWPAPPSAARTVLHLAEHDRFVPTRRIEQLAKNWGTSLLRHDDGHIGAVLGDWMIDLVAREAMDFARTPQSTHESSASL